MPGSSGGGPQNLRASAPGQYRAGGRVLALLEAPLNALVIRALAEGPIRIADLRKEVGFPAQTTLRGHLNDLIAVGAVNKLERRGMPYAVSHELSAEGQDLRFAVKVLAAWLAEAPQGEIKLGTDSAKGAVKGLAGGWDSAILRALSAQPRSLTELDEMISALSYPSLERRLSSMRVTGQVEPAQGQGGQGTPYTVTDWVRRGVAPLCAAGRWERRHLPKQTEPVGWVEVEAAFMLSLPLVKLPKRAKGECVLAVDTKDPEQRIAGVHIVVEEGKIVSCRAELKQHPPAYALATAESWLEAVIDSKIDRLHMCGEDRIVQQLVGGIHDALF